MNNLPVVFQISKELFFLISVDEHLALFSHLHVGLPLGAGVRRHCFHDDVCAATAPSPLVGGQRR
jgi:hypothetical protein